MPRANRYFIPGYVWHITHRCHKKEFLLKFVKDRQRWRYWLFEAKKRYGLCVLNYIVTSNHIHLLVQDRGKGEIAKSMQLIAGRTGQAYNQRKDRKGAFWEDRYHATAVDTEAYLARCMTYIDLNMVRAGVVRRPLEWDICGYREIQVPPRRYRVIAQTALLDLFGFRTTEQLKSSCQEWAKAALKPHNLQRESVWTESLAVGRPDFVEDVKERLGIRAKHRDVLEKAGAHVLKESITPYTSYLEPKMASLSGENRVFWD